MTAAAALASLVPVGLVAGAASRRSLAWGYAVAGSALAVFLTAITANVVGGVGLEGAVLAAAAALRLVTAAAASRRRTRALRRRQQRQLARAAAARRDRVAA